MQIQGQFKSVGEYGSSLTCRSQEGGSGGGAGGPGAGGWRSFAAAGNPERSKPAGGTIPAAVAVPWRYATSLKIYTTQHHLIHFFKITQTFTGNRKLRFILEDLLKSAEHPWNTRGFYVRNIYWC